MKGVWFASQLSCFSRGDVTFAWSDWLKVQRHMSANPTKIWTRLIATATCSVSGVSMFVTCIDMLKKRKYLNSYNEKLHDQYSPQNIIQRIKSRITRWPWHIAAHRVFWLGNLTERVNFENSSIDERIILNWVLKKYNRKDLDCFDLHQDWDRLRGISWSVEKNWLFKNDSASWLYFVTLMLMLQKEYAGLVEVT